MKVKEYLSLDRNLRISSIRPLISAVFQKLESRTGMRKARSRVQGSVLSSSVHFFPLGVAQSALKT
jgi:hypothetical protein